MLITSAGRIFVLLLAINCQFGLCQWQKRDQMQQNVERPDDLKKFKALLRTKNNVLVLFSKSGDNVPALKRLLPIFAEVGEKLYGKATVAVVNCGTEEGKKLCKKVKAAPEPMIIKHYNNGEFNKDYDRAETVDSIIRFLNDPTGDLPWEDEENAKDVLHVKDSQFWFKFIRKEKMPILGMFYAPWCGYCKRLKPEFSSAATELKGAAVLAGIDVTRTESYDLQQLYNITGYPTLLYFERGQVKFPFAGGNTKDGIVQWMKNPQPVKDKAQEEPTEKPWTEEEGAPVHLTDDSFDSFVAGTPSVLVMFYAPWCGHCKQMKPDIMEAAKRLKQEGVAGAIVAVDATKAKDLASKYEIAGYPTVKYFKEGKFAWDFTERTVDEIVAFMKDPKEPPPPPPPEQPWHEVESHVVHLTGENFKTELKKRRHAIVMFYAPWCGHCKAAKPEYTNAAARFKDDQKVLFGALDCTNHTAICQQQAVAGYPTFKYFSYLKTEESYEGQRIEIGFVSFMSKKIDPSASVPSASQPSPELWDSDFDLLAPATFHATLKQYKRSMVMYFAPWCGHCKKAKPEFIEAARASSKDVMAFAAVDCSANAEFCQQQGIQGYPAFHIYSSGQFERAYDGARSKEAFLDAAQIETKQPSQPTPEKPKDKAESTANKQEL